MNRTTIFILICFLLPVLCLAQDCEEYEKENKTLLYQIDSLTIALNQEKNEVESLRLKLQEEKENFSSYLRKYTNSREQKDQLQREFDYQESQVEKLEKERIQLKTEIDSLEKVLNQTEELQRRIDSLHQELERLTIEKKGLEIKLEQTKRENESLSNDIQKLEGQALDKIDQRKKIVHLEGKDYKYGKEIIFIPFTETSLGSKINLEIEGKIERLCNLVKGYDKNVKISLVGYSSYGNAEDRAKKVKEFMMTKYSLQENYFKNSFKTKKGKIGVAVRIVRR